MTKQLKPIIHARDHLADGADPIDWTKIPSGTPHGDYGDFVTSFSSLVGYWRLGEASSPFADTSGATGGPRNAVLYAAGTAMTANVTGALPSGQDDGAAQFNATAGGSADVLEAPDPVLPKVFNFAAAGATQTVAAWVKPAASASSFDGQIVGTFFEDAFGLCGWQLAVQWPQRYAFYRRRTQGSPKFTQTVIDGGTLLTTAWSLIVATHNGSDTAKLYVNGVLVDTDTTTLGGSLPSFGDGVAIGAIRHGASSHESFYGGIDEVAIWSTVLTADEVAELATRGDPTAATADAGRVLTSDGAGGSSWGWATIAVNY